MTRHIVQYVVEKRTRRTTFTGPSSLEDANREATNLQRHNAQHEHKYSEIVVYKLTEELVTAYPDMPAPGSIVSHEQAPSR